MLTLANSTPWSFWVPLREVEVVVPDVSEKLTVQSSEALTVCSPSLLRAHRLLTWIFLRNTSSVAPLTPPCSGVQLTCWLDSDELLVDFDGADINIRFWGFSKSFSEKAESSILRVSDSSTCTTFYLSFHFSLMRPLFQGWPSWTCTRNKENSKLVQDTKEIVHGDGKQVIGCFMPWKDSCRWEAPCSLSTQTPVRLICSRTAVLPHLFWAKLSWMLLHNVYFVFFSQYCSPKLPQLVFFKLHSNWAEESFRGFPSTTAN